MDPLDVARAMHGNDRAAQLLGVEIVSASTGQATVQMTVTSDMTNGLDLCHGGFLFTLADVAMAYASNSRNERSLATSASIDFVNPARVGQVLTATATEVSKPGRSAVNDATVTAEDGTLIAIFRGRTRTVSGSSVDESANSDESGSR